MPGPDPLFAMMGGGGPAPEYTLLATDKVRFVGDPVAIVVAESRYLAEDGCELVEVDYDGPAPGRQRGRRPRPGQPAAVRQPGRQHLRPAQAHRVRRRRRHVRGRRPGRRVPHRRAPPPERAHGGTRLRGELRRRHGHHDRARGDAGRARHQDGHRRAPRHGAGQGARPRRRHRRLVRPEDRRLPRGARRRGRVARARPAGQVDRGPQREPHRVRAGPRGELRRPGRRQQRRRPARP